MHPEANRYFYQVTIPRWMKQLFIFKNQLNKKNVTSMIAPIYIYTKCINQPYAGKKATMNSKHIFFVQVLYPFIYMRKITVKKAALQFGFLNLASYLKI